MDATVLSFADPFLHTQYHQFNVLETYGIIAYM